MGQTYSRYLSFAQNEYSLTDIKTCNINFEIRNSIHQFFIALKKKNFHFNIDNRDTEESIYIIFGNLINK